MSAKLIEKTGDWIFWLAIVLAGCWITTGDDRLERYVVIATFVGLALCLVGIFCQEYADDSTDHKRRFWRGVLQFLAVVFIGGAGLSLLMYVMALFDASTSESFRRTILTVMGIKLALGAIAVLSMKIVTRHA